MIIYIIYQEKNDIKNELVLLENENISLKTQITNFNLTEKNINNINNTNSKDDKNNLVEFQKKYLNEMKSLQISFESFKAKTYEDVLIKTYFILKLVKKLKKSKK